MASVSTGARRTVGSARSPGGRASARSIPTCCGPGSSCRRSTPGFPSERSRSPLATPTLGRRRCTTIDGRTSTSTPPTSWSPSWRADDGQPISGNLAPWKRRLSFQSAGAAESGRGRTTANSGGWSKTGVGARTRRYRTVESTGPPRHYRAVPALQIAVLGRPLVGRICILVAQQPVCLRHLTIVQSRRSTCIGRSPSPLLVELSRHPVREAAATIM